MRHLAILYTNNLVDDQIFDKIFDCFKDLFYCDSLPFETVGVVVSELPLYSKFREIEMGEIKNLIAPKEIVSKGHLSIINKISFALEHYPSDYVSLHEHDVLYPKEYLKNVQTVFQEFGDSFDYLAYNNLLGANCTGYQKRVIHDYPLSTHTFHYSVLVDLLAHKKKEYYNNNGWCYLEPGYGGSYGANLKRLELSDGSLDPIIHLNMNATTNNHHFTNHYLTYEPVSSLGFNEWPGDISYLFNNSI